MKKNEVYLKHIVDAIAQIESYVEGVDEAAFVDTRLVQDAVVRQLEIIGEASRSLSESFRQQHTAVPWRAIIGMRNRIAHDYLNIDVQVIWEVVRYDLPGLQSYIRHVLDDA